MLSAGDDLGQQVDADLVVDAGVERDVVQQLLRDLRLAVVQADATVAAPVVGHRAAAVRDDELQRGEARERVVVLDELHEGAGVAVDVVRAGAVEVGVARHR